MRGAAQRNFLQSIHLTFAPCFPHNRYIEMKTKGGQSMDERKATIASNLIRLRLAAGMTQAEVGEKLNYSDKTISKWERGEVTTDVFVLMEIAALFDVSVDYLLKPHAEIEPIVYNKPQEPHYNTRAITAIAVLGVWTLAFLVFLVLWWSGYVMWLLPVFAVPVSLVVLLVLQSVFHKGHGNRYIIAAIAVSLVTALYLTFLQNNPWQIFLLLIPISAIVFLAFRIKKR